MSIRFDTISLVDHNDYWLVNSNYLEFGGSLNHYLYEEIYVETIDNSIDFQVSDAPSELKEYINLLLLN